LIEKHGADERARWRRHDPGAIVRVCVFFFTFSTPPRRRDLGRHGEDGVIFIVSFLVNV
jgi:hypothetical protein